MLYFLFVYLNISMKLPQSSSLPSWTPTDNICKSYLLVLTITLDWLTSFVGTYFIPSYYLKSL